MNKRFEQIALTFLMAVTLAFGPSRVSAEYALCNGLGTTIEGTDGDDLITGTEGDDVIAGLGGSDTIDGLGGNDVICGDDGHDALAGGEGDDYLAGGEGKDTYVFGPAATPQIDTVSELENQGRDQLDFSALEPGDQVTVDLTSDFPIAFHINRTLNTASPGQATYFEDVLTNGSPEPTPESSPSPEPTAEITPNPEPTSEITPNPEPTPEITPSPEQAPETSPSPEANPVDTPSPEPTSGIISSPETTPETGIVISGHLTCNGLTTTIDGTSGDDVITGTAGDDVIAGLGGNDKIDGLGGNDTICGGSGNNILIGGEGDDYLQGDEGDDTYVFGPASASQTDTVAEAFLWWYDDTLDFSSLVATDPVTVNLTSDAPLASHTNRVINTAAPGQASRFDVVVGGAGDDTLIGHAVPDTLDGGPGNDTLLGGTAFNPGDTLIGGEGDDYLAGGAGFDTYVFGPALVSQTDTIVELAGEGNDLISFIALSAGDPMTANLGNDTPIATHTNRIVNTGGAGQAANFERVWGGAGNDIITGNDEDNDLEGLKGDDVLIGGDGNDYLAGGYGNDAYVFGPAVTPQTDGVSEFAYFGDTGDDWLDFGALEPGDAATVNLASDTPIATHTNRTVNVSYPGKAADFEHVFGGAGNDNITGNASDNILVGGDGNDSLAGGAGDDVYLFLPAAAPQTDTVQELAGEGIDDLLNFDLAAGDPVTVNLTSDTPIATHSNRTVNTAAAGQAANFEDVWNGAGDDHITGNAADNFLLDWEGNDFMAGGLGNDAYFFFPAAAPQTETVVELGSAGSDWLVFSALVDSSSIAQMSAEGVDLSGLRAGEIVPQVIHRGSEGQGVDVLQASDVVTVDLRVDNPIATHTNRTVKTGGSGQALNFENAVGGAGNDLIIGNKRRNILVGGAGNDMLKGLGRPDILIGEDGDDTLLGGRGTDIGDGGPGTDVCKVEIKYNCP